MIYFYVAFSKNAIKWSCMLLGFFGCSSSLVVLLNCLQKRSGCTCRQNSSLATHRGRAAGCRSSQLSHLQNVHICVKTTCLLLMFYICFEHMSNYVQRYQTNRKTKNARRENVRTPPPSKQPTHKIPI